MRQAAQQRANLPQPAAGRFHPSGLRPLRVGQGHQNRPAEHQRPHRHQHGRADQATARAVLTQWITDPNSIKPGTTKSANASRALDGMNIPADANGDGILQPEEFAPEKVDAIVSYLLSQTSSFPLQ